MRDYDDHYGRPRRDRDETQDYARREYEYRSGGHRPDGDYERGTGRDYGQGYGPARARDRGGADYAGGMMEDMRRYAHGDYDRGDDRSRGGYGYGEDRGYGHERDHPLGRGYYGRGEWDRSGRNERGFLERAGDEVASWFGDDDAERRRRMDEERSHRGRGPRGYTRSDDRIREDVSDRLTDDPYVDASDIDIAVSGGEVTLTGTVEHRSAKRRAEDVAEAVSGVSHVQNNLRVRQTVGTGTAAGASAMAGMGTTGMGGTAGSTTGGAASATTRTGDKMRT
ncbi:MAG: BON domain-containing protein [Thermoleophilia bacterium]|nr:BON domain-containing protein [Thermoleophilia bacterium]